MSQALTPIRAQGPADTRVYAIGDIHGRLDLLDRLLGQIARDADTAPSRRVLITMGDLIDRGADSAGVIKRLMELHTEPLFNGFKLHFLKGNHELVMEQFLAGESGGTLWFDNGGAETLESYGVPTNGGDSADLRVEARTRIPKSHLRFLESLQLQHREGDYAFVHAGVRPGVPLDRQDPDDLLWIRKAFLESTADLGAVIVHGHTPVETPEVTPNRIAIDTRAWYSGVLTCLVIDGEARRFLTTANNPHD